MEIWPFQFPHWQWKMPIPPYPSSSFFPFPFLFFLDILPACTYFAVCLFLCMSICLCCYIITNNNDNSTVAGAELMRNMSETVSVALIDIVPVCKCLIDTVQWKAADSAVGEVGFNLDILKIFRHPVSSSYLPDLNPGLKRNAMSHKSHNLLLGHQCKWATNYT